MREDITVYEYAWWQACERDLLCKIKDQTGMGTGDYLLAMRKLKLE